MFIWLCCPCFKRQAHKHEPKSAPPLVQNGLYWFQKENKSLKLISGMHIYDPGCRWVVIFLYYNQLHFIFTYKIMTFSSVFAEKTLQFYQRNKLYQLESLRGAMRILKVSKWQNMQAQTHRYTTVHRQKGILSVLVYYI